MNRKGTELKWGWFGFYNGNEYELTGDMKGNRIIRTKDKNIVDDTFDYDYETGIYDKIIDNSEIEHAYDLDIYALVDGKKIGVLKETEDEYLVSTGNKNMEIVEKYNLKWIDRGVYEGWIPKENVKILEEKRELQYDPKKKKLVFKDQIFEEKDTKDN